VNRFAVVGAAALAAVILTACVGDLMYPAYWSPVHSVDFGDQWPLTVDQGDVGCRHGEEALFRDADGTIYALNGAAVWAGYADLTSIWRLADDGVHRPDLELLLDAALGRCYPQFITPDASG
jgi:hypothetical protein